MDKKELKKKKKMKKKKKTISILKLLQCFYSKKYIIYLVNLKSKKKITAVTVPASVGTIQAKAFKGCRGLKTVTLKTKKLTAKAVKGSLRGSSVKTIKVTVGTKKTNKQYVKKYKKIFTKKNCGRTVKIK